MGDGAYVCWNCGNALPELLMPLSRRETCPSCEAEIHVCRMCVHFDRTVAKSCREPIAEEVRDKERANFCDYLELKSAAHDEAANAASKEARSELEALFGLPTGSTEAPQVAEPAPEADDAASRARVELERLFGDPGPKSD